MVKEMPMVIQPAATSQRSSRGRSLLFRRSRLSRKAATKPYRKARMAGVTHSALSSRGRPRQPHRILWNLRRAAGLVRE
jgi:hypothetical protein